MTKTLERNSPLRQAHEIAATRPDVVKDTYRLHLDIRQVGLQTLLI